MRACRLQLKVQVLRASHQTRSTHATFSIFEVEQKAGEVIGPIVPQSLLIKTTDPPSVLEKVDGARDRVPLSSKRPAKSKSKHSSNAEPSTAVSEHEELASTAEAQSNP